MRLFSACTFRPLVLWAALCLVALFVGGPLAVGSSPPAQHGDDALSSASPEAARSVVAAASGAAASRPAVSSSSARSSAGPAAQDAPSALADRIDRILESSRTGPVFWGFSVRSVETGQTLYAHNARHAFLPASNQKLFTTAVALEELGSTYRYETTLRFDGTAGDSTLQGDLILEGSGDPTFGSTEVRGEDPLRRWAERLDAMGVKRISGRLIGDDGVFGGQAYPEGWDIDYITRQAGRYLGVAASGLAYNDNLVTVRVRATEPGSPPAVSLRPASTVDIENRATTSDRWRGSSLQIQRTFNSNALILTGSVPRSYRGTLEVPVSDPTRFTLLAFKQALTEAGIATDSLRVLTADDANPGSSDTADPLFVTLSPPLSEILGIVNKESNNFYAEQVFRTYSWGGVPRGGARRTNQFLQRIGIDTGPLEIYDGSGLSRKDRITPHAMVDLLAHMADRPNNAFTASLPRGGERETTLQYRLGGVDVRAKTGSLRFVRALSGYVERPDGERVAFSFFANNYTGPSYRIEHVFNRIVRLIASSSVAT
jgi:D-alanyl-D-alanine carboxypeptidase/D-alanyl-D-alanine-endopeptidase (penicillin-binding protein 4)